MTGRALTDEQKRAVVERILAAWCKPRVSSMRLGQLIVVAQGNEQASRRVFYVEDEQLVADVEALAVMP